MVYQLSYGLLPKDTMFGTYLEVLEGDDESFELEDPTPDDGGMIVPRSTDVGRPLLSDNPPRVLRRGGPGPEVVAMLDIDSFGSFLVITEAVRAMIEALEPDIHQYWPVTIVVPDRDPARYEPEDGIYIGQKEGRVPDIPVREAYLLNVCKRLDTMDKELSHPVSDRGFFAPHHRKEGESVRLVYRREACVGHHLWIDKFVAMSLLVSDALAQKLKDAGTTGISLRHSEEV
ncbi:MAG: DUF1629 domain-containing protein [Pseudomonadota bacterium]